MKRLLIIALLLCCFTALASSEVLTAQPVDFPAFSFSVNEGSGFVRGEDTEGLLFIYYPQYAKGDVSTTISASADQLIQYNPVTMSEQERQQFAKDLLDATAASVQAYGMTVSDPSYSWSKPFIVDGQTGIKLSVHYLANNEQTNLVVNNVSCFFCVGKYRYNVSATAETEKLCLDLLDGFFKAFQWN